MQRTGSRHLPCSNATSILGMLPIVCAVEERVPRGNDHRRITSAVEKLKELDSVRQAASREMLHGGRSPSL
ncbi:hypothetical protein JG687_00019283 [Phytophthora cactorum]|uniref:Uncharacterized protein n=1 Tax=Phytophthora cactorum TaxID=29920 RepID=A0A8T1TLM1_9STRA|nr:hypothetical protein JG687_00019283 [Phytophthora cactorum]